MLFLKIVKVPVALILFVSAFGDLSGSLSSHWICTEPARSVSRLDYRKQYYTKAYSCGWWGWSRCRRTLSRSQSVMLYMLRPATSMCCPGYVNSTEGTCIPYCENCTSPKKCVEPKTCVCPPGWSGDDCSLDVDECQIHNGGCNQTCTNTQGSYICRCIGQYILDDDQHGCIEPVQMAVTFVGNGTETFSIKWSVPTQNRSSIPKGVTLNCTNTSYNVILNTSITHADTTVRLDLNKTVMCCVSAPSTKTKCVTYTPDVNGPGIKTTTDSATQDNDKLAIIGGVAGALLLLMLLAIAVMVMVLISKAVKSRNKRLQQINELSSNYERDYQVQIYERVDSSDLQAVNHLSSPYTQIPRGRRVQYASIRFENKRQATQANIHKVPKPAVSVLGNEDENGYLRLM